MEWASQELAKHSGLSPPLSNPPPPHPRPIGKDRRIKGDRREEPSETTKHLTIPTTFYLQMFLTSSDAWPWEFKFSQHSTHLPNRTFRLAPPCLTCSRNILQTHLQAWALEPALHRLECLFPPCLSVKVLFILQGTNETPSSRQNHQKPSELEVCAIPQAPGDTGAVTELTSLCLVSQLTDVYLFPLPIFKGKRKGPTPTHGRVPHTRSEAPRTAKRTATTCGLKEYLQPTARGPGGEFSKHFWELEICQEQC